jgi:hypothetical protein
VEVSFFIFVIIAFAVLLRYLEGSFDGDRVQQYIQERGGELLNQSWDPLGPGWIGEEDSRIYEIIYRDSSGSVHRAHVKTSMMSGVYLTNDRIIKDPPPTSD